MLLFIKLQDVNSDTDTEELCNGYFKGLEQAQDKILNLWTWNILIPPLNWKSHKSISLYRYSFGTRVLVHSQT